MLVAMLAHLSVPQKAVWSEPTLLAVESVNLKAVESENLKVI
jgi:hypothetical protein